MEEARALETLKIILKNRGVVDANGFQQVANPADETHMFTYGGVLVVFSEKTRVSERELNNLLAFATENDYSGGMIIVTPTRSSDSVLTALRRYVADTTQPLIQIFEMRHLQFDISAHRKQPKHRVMSVEETAAMLKEFHIPDVKRIPKIDCQDPMAKWIGARPGQVIEVLGLCETSGDNRRYRLCVESAADA
jgi:DNA-directed RNA polymerase I, II, and III subunit RPABC1